MRIALVSDCAHPTPNGVSEQLRLLADGLRARGHSVAVAAPGPGRATRTGRAARSPIAGAAPRAQPGTDLTPRGIAVLPSVGFRGTVVRPERIARWLAAVDAEVVHTHTEGPLGLAARAAARAQGRPLVHTLHTFYAHYLHYLGLPRPTHPGWRRGLDRTLGRFLAPYDRLVAPSPAAQRELERLAPRIACDLVPNGIRLDHPVPGPGRRAELRARYDLHPDRALVLAIGRAAPEKRADALVTALLTVLPGYPDVEVRLLGGGRQLRALRRRVAASGPTPRLALPGRVPHDDVLDLVALAAVVLTASRSENHPLSLLEAAAGGCALVARDDAGLTAIVQPGHTGVLASGDLDLAEAALHLASDAPRAAKLGAGARRWVAGYGIDAQVRGTAAVYDRCVGDAPPAGQRILPPANPGRPLTSPTG